MEKKIFKFKNNRNYVHGTDIYNFLVKKNKFKLIDIKFRKLLKTHPIIKSNIQKTSGKLIKNNLCVEGKLKTGKQIKKIFFFNSKKKIKEIYKSNENISLNYFHTFKKSIKCNFISKLTPIEIVVAMTKTMHLKKISSKKKWLLTRIKLIKNLKTKQRKNYKLTLKDNYNNLFTKSLIYEGNKKIGHINFSSK